MTCSRAFDVNMELRQCSVFSPLFFVTVMEVPPRSSMGMIAMEVNK